MLQLQDTKVGVLGIGRTGLAAIKWLQRQGAHVWGWDDKQGCQLPLIAAGVPLLTWRMVQEGAIDALVVSPGLPYRWPQPHPWVVRARQQGIALWNDMDLLSLSCPQARFIGVTGTNGKSTTTALIHHILESNKMNVATGGNNGIPVLSLAEPAHNHYVLEVSSYQLDLMESLFFDTAILLNITPDHLDRHGGMAGYIAAKQRILRLKPAPQTFIISIDTPPCAELFKVLSSLALPQQHFIPVSTQQKLEKGLYYHQGQFIDGCMEPHQSFAQQHDFPLLPGVHNAENILCAYGAAKAEGLDPIAIAQAMRQFSGLAHRQEIFMTHGSVRFVNDSKATNVEAACRALASFDNILWIAGGSSKGESLDPILLYKNQIAQAFLIGEAAEMLGAFCQSSEIPARLSGTLGQAVAEAWQAAQQLSQPSTILLSPACASFDQFRDFEHRGDAFKQAVTDCLAQAGL